VVLFHAVRTGRLRYRISLEPFDRIVLRRETRTADLRDYVTRYAAALERACRAYPLQWFNFFPFWEHEDAEAEPAPPAAAPPAVLAQPRPG
jgi:predicted LPLAT superfamily acyltransferase